MGKLMACLGIFWLATAPAFAQTAKFTAPKAGDSWPLGTPRTVAWTGSGSATVKLVLISQSGGNLGIIQSGLSLASGSFSWTVGSLENGKSAPAAGDCRIRLVTVPNNDVLAVSPLFAIAAAGQAGDTQFVQMAGFSKVILQSQFSSKSIAVSQPKAGEVWVPLKAYGCHWSWTVLSSVIDCKPTANCNNGCAVDVWLVPQASPGDKVPLAQGVCSGYSYQQGKITYSGSYSGVVPNVASGSYVVRVARSDNPAFCGDSPAFTVKSTLSGDTAFLGPDATQNQADLALTDVFFDNEARIAIKVKNLGDEFRGYIPIDYKCITIGSANETLKEGKCQDSYFLLPGEERAIVLTDWGGFTFSSKGWDGGSPSQGIPSRFIPVNSRPFQATVTIKPAGDMNPSDNWVSKRMCMIQQADVGTDGQIRLDFSPQSWVYIATGTANQIHADQIRWVGADEFEAGLEVFLWNYGCAPRSFDCWLYVDDLPGRKVADNLALQPGYRVQWKQTVRIRLPERCGDHRLVFVADPAENKNEPYPNSYQNNFIRCFLKIKCGGTITGGL